MVYLNRGSAFSEFIQLCAKRVIWLIGIVLGFFLVTFVYTLIVTPEESIVRAQLKVSPKITSESISTARDSLELANLLVEDAIFSIENADTIAKALTSANLITTYNPEDFKTRVKAEEIGNSSIMVTISYEGSWREANVFMATFLDTCIEDINAEYTENGYDFEIGTSEAGRTYEETSKAAPAFLNGLYAALIGFALFLLVNALLFVTDRTMRSHNRLYKITDIPTIAAIPSTSRVGSGEKMGQKIGNAYQTLRSAVKYSEKRVRSIAICSAQPRDGRTSVAIGLATALAETDAMVLLIEADMRRPSISPQMKIESTFGLADLLLGKTNLAATICKTSNRNLYVITAVNNTNLNNINIADLLDSVVFDELIESVQSQFDYVIIDTPSVELVADATSVVGKVDASILVAQYGRTNLDAFKSTADILKALGGDVLGVVTTNTQQHTGLFSNSANYYKSGRNSAKGMDGIASFFAKKN